MQIVENHCHVRGTVLEDRAADWVEGFRILTVAVIAVEPVDGFPELVSQHVIDGKLPLRVAQNIVTLDNARGYLVECPASVTSAGDVLAKPQFGDDEFALKPAQPDTTESQGQSRD